MNANEMPQKPNVRLRRIKIVSRVLKVLFVLFLLCLGYLGHFPPFVQRMPDGVWWVAGQYTATFSAAPLAAMLIVGLGVCVLLATIITCSQLLNLYEKGIIFRLEMFNCLAESDVWLSVTVCSAHVVLHCFRRGITGLA